MARKEALTGQRFSCDRPGCNKHYSRPDHLLRHKLNHDREKVLACNQCDRTFVRQDLLARHLERHAVRGKTLGRWSGKRKRDGFSEGSSQGHIFRDDPENEDEEDEDRSFSNLSNSIGSTSGVMQRHLQSDERYADPFHYENLPPPPPPPPVAQYEDPRLIESSQNRFAQSLGGVPMREDLASLSAASLQFPISNQISSFGNRASSSTYTIPAYGAWQRPFEQVVPSQDRQFQQLPSSNFPLNNIGGPALLESSVPGSSHFTFSNPQTGDLVADYDWLFDGVNPLLSSSAIEVPQSETFGIPMTEGFSSSLATDEDESAQPDDSNADAPAAESGALHDLAFFASLQRDIPDEPAFEVDASVHARLLHFLSALQELPNSPLFTPPALRCYLHLFFSKVNTTYPLIHRPTFSAKSADPMLLSAMIVCGAHFADEAAHFLAERIARKLWGAYISFEDFRPARATLAMLQAMLLTELFGKTMGTRPQHETAHLFHNFIITLARRNAVFTPSKISLPSNPEEKWRVWAKEEEKKRIAFFAFLLDAQHAIVFRHIPALSSFQIHLQLPCLEAIWEAKSSQEWRTEREKEKGREPPSFIAALKASLPSAQPSSSCPNDSFQQFVLLHGLMSVAYDLQWKQQTLLAAPETSDSISNWKTTVKTSYIASLKRLDEGSKKGASETSRCIAQSSQCLVLWAQVVLHADAVDIQIYAGLPTVLGRFIDHHTFSVARKSCREWAKSEDARIAVYLASGHLKETLLKENEAERHMNSGYDENLVAQWVQYLCVLVIWAYNQALIPSNKGHQREEGRRSPSREADTTLETSNLLQVNGMLAHRDLAQKVPNSCISLERSCNEARMYIDQVLASDPSDEYSFAPPHQYISGILELLERVCRGSRWELGREVSGVLRKLIRERSTSANRYSPTPTPTMQRLER